MSTLKYKLDLKNILHLRDGSPYVKNNWGNAPCRLLAQYLDYKSTSHTIWPKMLKHKILVVADMVCYIPNIIHVDFQCGTGCYQSRFFILNGNEVCWRAQNLHFEELKNSFGKMKSWLEMLWSTLGLSFLVGYSPRKHIYNSMNQTDIWPYLI